MKDTEQSDRSAVLDERRSAILERSNFDVSSHDEGDTPGRDSYSSDASGTFKVLSKLEKWGDYENYGAPVGPARFIPLKTPLTNEILQGRQFGSNFTLREFLDSQKALERKVGMIIDLSNHDCLYSQDIPTEIRYKHIRCVAKVLPDMLSVKQVFQAALQFWEENPEEYIGIHCSYGFNRTGFLVCSFLVEHCGLSVQSALQSFGDSRPPGVKHDRFKEELQRRYGTRTEETAKDH